MKNLFLIPKENYTVTIFTTVSITTFKIFTLSQHATNKVLKMFLKGKSKMKLHL